MRTEASAYEVYTRLRLFAAQKKGKEKALADYRKSAAVIHMINHNYLRRSLSGEGIVSLVVRHAVCVCLSAELRLYHISLGSEGNALYPVLSR